MGDDDEVLLVSANGVLIRMPVSSISSQGAYATGVKVMALPEGDRVAAVAPVLREEASLEDDLAALDELDQIAGDDELGEVLETEMVLDDALDADDADDADDGDVDIDEPGDDDLD